eukprot:Tbor_TRINITY_DN116_c0_g1::TRINITY_DN116_c0_g1_i1::g.11989::m.11989/K10417/DYNC2LI; dynein light intermediate chain 2, cytosolic
MSDIAVGGHPAQSGQSDTQTGTLPQEPQQPSIKIDPTKDLWANIAANVKEAAHESTDQTVLVCGCKQCGKTSIIQRMLGATSGGGSIKPTTALEYCYGKKEDRNAVQIAHFWELAQGMDLAQLSDIVLTPENIHATLVVIVVDLGDPSSAWDNAIFWLKKIDSRSQELFQKMRAKGSSTPDKLLEKAKVIINVDHPDLSRIRSSGVPTVLVGSRLDKFKLDTSKLKCISKTLRYLAHLYGASLIFTSEHERESTKLRSLLNHLIFQTPFDKKFIQFDCEKGGVLVPVGLDTFASIGDPVPCNMNGFKPTGDAELDRWKAPFDEAFPISPSSVNRKNIDGGDAEFLSQLYTSNGYGEPLIDSMRKQKDAELEQYRKNALTSKKEKKGGDG